MSNPKGEATMKTKITLAALVAAAIAPAPAGAHVTVAPEEAAADDYAYLQFSVPHGCDGSSTTRLRVQVPENVVSVTPQVNPGWSLETKSGPKEETELHGETITEGVREITWTAENAPLPDEYLDVFGVSARMPAAPGETVYFPTIQECENGATRWIEVPAAGESPEELEEPAPALTLNEPDGAHAASAPDGGGEEGIETDVSDSDGLAIAGLVVGGLGLLMGGAALARSHRDR